MGGRDGGSDVAFASRSAFGDGKGGETRSVVRVQPLRGDDGGRDELRLAVMT